MRTVTSYWGLEGDIVACTRELANLGAVDQYIVADERVTPRHREDLQADVVRARREILIGILRDHRQLSLNAGRWEDRELV